MSNLRPCLGALALAYVIMPLSVRTQSVSENESKQVILHVTVTDKHGKFVNDLKADAFKLYDEGELKPISLFKEGGEPTSMGVMIDMSGSMGYSIPGVLAQALQGIILEGSPESEYFALSFSDTVSVTPLTKEKQAILDALGKLTSAEVKNKTKLFDALQVGLEKLETSTYNKRAIVIVSDGRDNSSKTKYDQIKWLLRESNVQLFLISTEIPEKKEWDKLAIVTNDLERIVMASGGSVFFVKTFGEIRDVADRIAQDLKHQYTLGFTASKYDVKKTDKWRKLNVKINPDTSKKLGNGLVVTTRRTGYYTTVK